MASMADASLVLPFLPLTAGQILLNNFLSDIPAVGIADNSVDPELSIRFTPDGRNLVRPSAGALKILHSWRPPRVAQQHVSRQELLMQSGFRANRVVITSGTVFAPGVAALVWLMASSR